MQNPFFNQFFAFFEQLLPCQVAIVQHLRDVAKALRKLQRNNNNATTKQSTMKKQQEQQQQEPTQQRDYSYNNNNNRHNNETMLKYTPQVCKNQIVTAGRLFTVLDMHPNYHE